MWVHLASAMSSCKSTYVGKRYFLRKGCYICKTTSTVHPLSDRHFEDAKGPVTSSKPWRSCFLSLQEYKIFFPSLVISPLPVQRTSLMPSKSNRCCSNSLSNWFNRPLWWSVPPFLVPIRVIFFAVNVVSVMRRWTPQWFWSNTFILG